MAERFDYVTVDDNNTQRFPENMPLSAVNDGARAQEGINARDYRDNAGGAVTTAGTSAAYTVTPNRTITANEDGLEMSIQLHTASGASPTLAVGTAPAAPMVWPNNTAIGAGELPSGYRGKFKFDGTSWRLFSATGAAPFVSPIASEGDLIIGDGTAQPIALTKGAQNELLIAGAARPEYSGISAVIDAVLGNTQGDILYRDASGWAKLGAGTAGQVLQTGGAGANPSWADSAGGITVMTALATTTGTNFDFTDIPATAKRIQVILEEVSLNASNDDLLVQLGDAGGIETAGYVATSSALSSGTSSVNGFPMFLQNSAGIVSAVMTFVNIDGNTWIGSHGGKISTSQGITGGGSKTLSATLTQVRLTRTGADTFNGGKVNVLYEV